MARERKQIDVGIGVPGDLSLITPKEMEMEEQELETPVANMNVMISRKRNLNGID